MSALLPSDKQPWALENSSLCNTAKGLSPRAVLFLHLGTRWIFSALICIASSWRMVFASMFSMAALRWHCLKFVSQAWRALASFLARRVVVTQRRLGNNPLASVFPGLPCFGQTIHRSHMKHLRKTATAGLAQVEKDVAQTIACKTAFDYGVLNKTEEATDQAEDIVARGKAWPAESVLICSQRAYHHPY